MNDKERVIAKLTDDYSRLGKEELLKLGFRHWNKESGLLLIPIDLYDKIPDGTKLTSIDGEEKIKGKDGIDNDTRGGLLAWGLMRE